MTKIAITMVFIEFAVCAVALAQKLLRINDQGCMIIGMRRISGLSERASERALERKRIGSDESSRVVLALLAVKQRG